MKQALVLETYDEIKNAMMSGKDINFEMVIDGKKEEVEAKEITAKEEFNIGAPYYVDGKLMGIYAGNYKDKNIIVLLNDAPDKLTHDKAVEYCNGNTRLPTKEELMIIYLYKDIINQSLAEYGGDILKDEWYWSSTNGGTNYYIVSMSNGHVDYYYDSNYIYVRPVLAF